MFNFTTEADLDSAMDVKSLRLRLDSGLFRYAAPGTDRDHWLNLHVTTYSS
jgi:hypothetical protein